tara:strand:+ start:1918 stop:2190 length:273 start_codon:yes stop_codon:yes gene_type:complete
MPKFENVELGVDVETVELTQRQAVPYWKALQEMNGATGPEQWHAVLKAAVEGKWFEDKKIDPLDFTPAQARWLAEELATHLLEESQIPNP